MKVWICPAAGQAAVGSRSRGRARSCSLCNDICERSRKSALRPDVRPEILLWRNGLQELAEDLWSAGYNLALVEIVFAAFEIRNQPAGFLDEKRPAAMSHGDSPISQKPS